MNTILRTGIIQRGQIVIDEPIDLPDGSAVTIVSLNVNEPRTGLGEIDFMTEDEQSDDPEAIDQWIAALRAIPPVPMNTQDEAEWRDWNEKMRQFNIEAMRKQFEENTP
jgi:hypothetical protein